MNAFELSQHIAARLDEDPPASAIERARPPPAWAIPRDTRGGGTCGVRRGARELAFTAMPSRLNAYTGRRWFETTQS